MKKNITFDKIVENLVKVFNSAEETAVYNYNSLQRVMFCGWCGSMSPVTRPAYVEDFGAESVEKAEREARARLADNARQYDESNHAAHVTEAAKHQNEGNRAPLAGSFVYAIHSGYKCDGGRGLAEELENIAEDSERMEKRGADLCHVVKVYEVAAQDFARPELADELVSRSAEQGEDFPGGGNTDDPDRRDLFDDYRYYYTEAAAVVCRKSGRWFLINSEGYTYARYILVPTSWRAMYADEVEAIEQAKAYREEQERKAEEQAKADRLAAYRAKCAKYAGRLEDIAPYMEAVNAAAYHTPEYKKAARDLQTARRRNLVAMARTIYPTIKATAKKSDAYAAAYVLTYQDGPTLKTFRDNTDFGLFTQAVETFNGYDDSTEFVHREFVEFAEKYMGVHYGAFQTAREWSAKTRADLMAAVLTVAPGAAEDVNTYESPYKWTREDLQQIAERTGANVSYLVAEMEDKRRHFRYTEAETVARLCFDTIDYTTNPTPTKPRTADNTPADGLALEDIAGGVAVVGNSRTTYRNRKAIKAHGCTWNREAQRWEATTPEAVAAVRAWFGLTTTDTDTQSESEGTEAPATAPTLQQAQDITEHATTDQQPAENMNGAQSEQDEPEEFHTVEFYNREGVTDEQGRRVKTSEQITQQAGRIECNYFAGRGGLRAIARRLYYTKGANAPDTVAAYERLQSRAAWLRRAELAAHTAAGRKHRAAYLRDANPTPTNGGKGAEGIQEQTECTSPVIEPVKNDRISRNENCAAESLEVTNPIKADDLNTPRTFQLSERRDIVKGCTPEQAGELERMGGKRTAAGVVFRASKRNRCRLHIWQNEQSRKERAAMLGEGWQWMEGINNGTEPGDEIITIDGTRGRVTKSDGEHCGVEFKTEDGQYLSVAGYFRKNCDTATLYEAGEIRTTAEGDKGDEFRPAFRYVINEVGNYSHAEDLPASLTLNEARQSNHLHADALTDERTGETIQGPTHILYEYCEEGDEGTSRIAYGQTEAQALFNHRNGYFGLFHAEHAQTLPTDTDPTPEPSGEGEGTAAEDATLYEAGEITETAEGIKVGDTVKHNKHEEVATVTGIREAFVNRCDGYRYLYTLDFGQSVKGPFGVELNGGEFLRDAFTPCTPDGRELLPEPPTEITTDVPTLYEASEIRETAEDIDPRFTINRTNISPADNFVNDQGTRYADIREEDAEEARGAGLCRYMTKRPGGEWTENRCMSWHSLEYSLYVFNARRMTDAEVLEDRDGMEKPANMYALAANIDQLLRRIASRGTAFAEVLGYIECYKDMACEFLDAMGCRDSLDHFRRWCAARQKHLRRKSA